METRPHRSSPLNTFMSRRTVVQRLLFVLFILLLVAVPLVGLALNSHDSSSADTIAQQLKPLRLTIITLPENTAQARLKKAALLWTLGKVTTELNNGHTDTAASLLSDIGTMRKHAIGKRLATPANLFPPIPDSAANPFVPHMFDDMQKLFKISDLVSIPRDTLQVDTLAAAQALGHPQSPLKDDPRVMTLLFNLLDREFNGWTDKTISLADLENSNYPVAYAMLTAVYPDLIPATIKTEWEQAILLNAQQIVTNFGDVYNNHRSYQTWWNNDIRQAQDLLASSWDLHNTDFRRIAQNIIATLAQNAYRDGAFSYQGLENDSCASHGDDILYLAWYWLLSGDGSAKQMLLGAKHFYPLCYDSRGVAEDFTSPADAHYWNQRRPGEAAYIIAGMTGDPYNATLAGDVRGSEIDAIFYHADLAKKTLPDNYLLYDRNVQGPRGHFGLFSFAGSTRDASVTGRDQPDSNLGMGKSTFVGAMLLDPSSSAASWPLNVALDSVSSEVQTTSAGSAMGLDRQNFRSFPQNERDAVTVSQNFAALSTSYLITNKINARGSFNSLKWQGDQQWLFLPDRIIGLLSVTSLVDQQAYGVDGTIKLVAGRDTWGTKKTFQALDPSTVRYGNMIVHIQDQNYGGKLQTGLEATSLIDPTDSTNKSGRIVIRDIHANGIKPIIYGRGETHYYEVEIFPASSTADQASKLSLSNRLQGLQATEQGRALQLIANPTSAPLTYTTTLVTPYQHLSIHSSNGSIQTIAVKGALTIISTIIPAYSNVVIINSDKSGDHTSGSATAATIFGN